MRVSDEVFQSAWYDHERQPLKWYAKESNDHATLTNPNTRQYPVGLLFDLHATDLSKTWNLTLHFKDLPSDSILLKPTPETMQDMFMSMIKEVDRAHTQMPPFFDEVLVFQADFLRNGNIKKVMNLSKRDTTQLWDSLASGTLALNTF